MQRLYNYAVAQKIHSPFTRRSDHNIQNLIVRKYGAKYVSSINKGDKPAEERIKKLREDLKKYNEAYYLKAQSLISDQKYDELFDELKRLEDKYPQFSSTSSPTQIVGAELNTQNVIPHRVPMLSLNNTYSKEELIAFDKRIKKLTSSSVEYVCELKYDGIAVSLLYEDGAFVRALSRGDGTVGEDITNNILLTIPDLPKKIQRKLYESSEGGDMCQVKDFEVRGEVMMSRNQFEELNSNRTLNGFQEFKNARNLVAGIMRLDLSSDSQNNGNDKKKQNKNSSYSTLGHVKLNFVAYSLLPVSQKSENSVKSLDTASDTCIVLDKSTHSEYMSVLSQLGFSPDKEAQVCNSIDEVIEFTKKWESKRQDYPFGLDGVVIKVNSIELQSQLGNIARAPRWAIAFKYPMEKVLTTLKGIALQVGRTGRVTPVAELEPIHLAGSTISRATLHNFDYIISHGIRIGDKVLVEKGGEVIPKITGVKSDSSTTQPVRLSDLFATNNKGELLCSCQEKQPLTCKGGVDYVCSFIACPEQKVARLIHFASRKAMDIEGLGDKIVLELITKGMILNPADIYELHKHQDELLTMNRWGKLKVENLMRAIESSKSKPFSRVLYALGIPHVGSEVAQLLADQFHNLEALKSSTVADLLSVHSIGNVIAESVVQFFQLPANVTMCQKLKEVGLDMGKHSGVVPSKQEGDNGISSIASKESIESSPSLVSHFKGKNVVITGTFEAFKREEIEEIIRRAGGFVKNTVGKNVGWLIVGQKAGSKIEKAKLLGLSLITEDELKKLL